MRSDEREIVYSKLRTMVLNLDELEPELPASLADYHNAGNVIRGFTERKCQLVVECGTDANGVLLSMLGEPNPQSARDSYDRVHELGAISEETHRRFHDTFVGFRNRLVHDYEEIDDEAVYRTARLLLTHARRYAAEAMAFLDRLCAEDEERDETGEEQRGPMT